MSSDKTSKAEARYRDYPSGKQRCVVCAMFVVGGSCRAVEGRVSAHGWCALFERKAAPAPFTRSE